MDGFDGLADACSRRQVQEDRAAPIFLEFELNPRVEACDVDAGDSRRQPLVAIKEAPLIEQIEPQLRGGGRGGRWRCIHGCLLGTSRVGGFYVRVTR